ncbi:hypothetical protein H6F95_31845 [Cyanobacteria bacterium FACHB-471]|nr:hypothetical protein [Cyanobacteria bacterium FACHB-471]
MKSSISNLPNNQSIRWQHVGTDLPVLEPKLLVLLQATVVPKLALSGGDGKSRSRSILRQLCQVPVLPLEPHPSSIPDIR